MTLAWAYLLAMICTSCRIAGAQSPPGIESPAPGDMLPGGEAAIESKPLPSTVFKTMGGVQFWGDELFYGQWRIQRHVLSGHCRLLDPENGCHALGSFDRCQVKLGQLRIKHELHPVKGAVVVTLHGLGRGRASMNPIADHLRGDGRFSVINVTYPSTRAGVGDHARALAAIVGNLEQATEINFVAHSLGNLVIRHYLADQTDAAKGLQPDPRIRRIVMLGPPNHGALAASTFENNWAFRRVLGRSAQQIAGWDELEPRLATPRCQFGIIAGGRGNDTGFNPLLPGDDDGTVSVAETRLGGAHDFLMVDVLHTFLMHNESVLGATSRFLRQGHFAEDGIRQPIELSTPSPGAENVRPTSATLQGRP